MDLFHHDVHNLTDQEKQTRATPAASSFANTRGCRAIAGSMCLGERSSPLTCATRGITPAACHFSLMLILFHEDLHRRIVAHDNDLEAAYQGVWACCLRLASCSNRALAAPQPECIGVLGYLVHFIYDGDPRRNLEPEEDCSLIA